MKLSEKIGVRKTSRLPKFNADDTFRQKFVKYARWLGKSFPNTLSSSDGLNFCSNRLEVLLPLLMNFIPKDFSGYTGISFPQAELELDKNSILLLEPC